MMTKKFSPLKQTKLYNSGHFVSHQLKHITVLNKKSKTDNSMKVGAVIKDARASCLGLPLLNDHAHLHLLNLPLIFSVVTEPSVVPL